MKIVQGTSTVMSLTKKDFAINMQKFYGYIHYIIDYHF